MAAPESAVETTTALALEEKGKLKKSLRRVDMLLFTICAMVGVDTLGQVSSFGAQTFFWIAILSVFFLLPYAFVMSELGSSFVQEGGPYEWMKLCYGRLTAGFGAVLYWITNPLWVGGTLCFLASSAFSEYFIHLGGPEDRLPRRHPARRSAVQGGLHLDQHRRRDRGARPRQVDPELRRGLPCLRAALLLVHRADLRVQARHQRLRLQGLHPGRDVGLGHRWSSSESCRCCSSTTWASSSRTERPRRWSIRRRMCRSRSSAARSRP